MLRKIRIILAAAMFALVTLLFLDFTGTIQVWAGWTAKMQLLPALLSLNAVVIIVLVVTALIFGRVYCSVICPLGVMQDIIAWLHDRMGGRRARNRYRHSREKRVLRYALLLLTIAALCLGISTVVVVIEPYSMYGRIASRLLQPLWIAANNGLAAIAESVGSYAFYSREAYLRSGTALIIAVVTIVVIAVLAWRGGRTYCNTICPVGTLLSLPARFSLLKMRIDTNLCNGCGLCARNCKAACIDSKQHKIDYSRCVTCGNCEIKCSTGALRYSLPTRSKRHTVSTESRHNTQGKGRRLFLLGAVGAAASYAAAQEAKKVDGGLAVIKDRVPPRRSTPVTPPGSLSAANLARHCTGCQLCIAECPNHVLSPSASLATLMQPTMSFDRGYCRPECTRCSEVCPTAAIRPITREERTATQTGHAVWIKKNCIVITDGVQCGNCARHCPAEAITMVPMGDGERPPLVPAVNTERCIGCGACEHLCPARPFGAIYVEGHEQHRII